MRSTRSAALLIQSVLIVSGLSLACGFSSDMAAAGQKVSVNPVTLKLFDRDQIKAPDLDVQSARNLEYSRVNHWPVVAVLVLARTGMNSAVAHKFEALGGEVHFRADEIDYIRGILPTANVDVLFWSSEVLDMQVGMDDYTIDVGPEYHGKPGGLAPAEEVPVDKSLPLLTAADMTAHPELFPASDIGAPQFVAEHPTYDGRGVTIAMFEDDPDFSHPVLQGARAIDGTPLDKIAGFIDVTDLDHDDKLVDELGAHKKPQGTLPYAVSWHGTVTIAENARFDRDGRSFVAPGPGTYEYGTVKYPRKASVLWDRSNGLVWIDANNDGSFADEKPLHDFNEKHEVGFFPSLPAPPDSDMASVDRSVSFVVLVDESHSYVRVISPGDADYHATMTTAIAAGKHFLGSNINGVAPEARLMIVTGVGNRIDEVIEGELAAEKDPRVDIISCETGAHEFFDDGESVLSIAADRMVARFKKPMFESAGNYTLPNLGSVSDDALAASVIAVGGYNSGATRHALASVIGATPRGIDADYINEDSSLGPGPNGSIKPDFLAPNWEVSPAPCAYIDHTAARLGYLRHQTAQNRIPPCYMLGGGTSSAAPFAAGAAALLISAARQSGLSCDASAIKWALQMSARALKGYGVYRQGSGLIQIPEAWKLLQQYAKKPDVRVSFLSSVDVAEGGHPKTAGWGIGLNESKGWDPGKATTRYMHVLRTGGTAETLHSRIELVGDDGTFVVQTRIDLPRNQPITIPIHIRAAVAGIHDSIFRLVDEKSNLPLAQTALTIISAPPLSTANPVIVKGTLQPGESREILVNIVPNTPVSVLKLGVAAGNLTFYVHRPSPVTSPVLFGGTGVSQFGVLPGRQSNSWVQLQENAEPGIWMFRVLNGELSLSDRVQYVSTAQFSFNMTTKKSGSRNVNVKEAGFSQQSAVETSHASFSTVDWTIPAATRLIALDVRSAVGAPGDVYLFNCSLPQRSECGLWTRQSLDAGKTRIYVRWPSPGTWKILTQPLGRGRSEQVSLVRTYVPKSLGAKPPAQWRPVIVSETVDPDLEREEETSPLNNWTGWSRHDFRPVFLNMEIAPDPSAEHAK